MSQDVNKVILVGRLGADSDLKHVGDNAVLSFRVATTEDYKPKNGGEPHTEWSQCSLWGKRAEGLSQYLVKGTRVYVEGRIKTRTYEKDGQKRYATEINVDEVKLLGGGKREEQGGNARPSVGRPAEKKQEWEEPDASEIPF